jgi:aspartyl/asparaginyl beta-hydroxylase (cupin superfamily)
MSVSEDAARLNREAVKAMAGRRLDEAARLLVEALTLDARSLPAWMNLAAIKRAQGDLPGAMQAVDKAREVDQLYFPALLMRGTLYEAMGKPRHAAYAYTIALTQMLPEDVTDAATERAVSHARDVLATHRDEMESFLRHEMASEGAVRGDSAAARRMNGFIGHVTGKRRLYQPNPSNFYYPGLAPVEFFDRKDFPWTEALEAATPDVQAELAGVFADEAASAGIVPYAQVPDTEPIEQWAELNNSLSWSAYHFALHGQLNAEHRAKCPKTAALLDGLPQPFVQHRSPTALFSILRPGTHIPPHCGYSNFRLICHLPLVLPPDCQFRVGNETRQWRIGETLIFDDTIEHEAWNRSGQIRTVLIFDIWHPGLNDDERAFVSRTIAALDRFNESA